MINLKDTYNEVTFLLNKNKYTLRWEKDCAKDMQYILLNYFIDYLKDHWSTSDVLIKVPGPPHRVGRQGQLRVRSGHSHARPSRNLLP